MVLMESVRCWYSWTDDARMRVVVHGGVVVRVQGEGFSADTLGGFGTGLSS
jgi:hypothetical protein